MIPRFPRVTIARTEPLAEDGFARFTAADDDLRAATQALIDAQREIADHLPTLQRDRHTLMRQRVTPAAVILPARILGLDRPRSDARLFGLPIVWVDSEVWAIAIGTVS